MNLAPASAETFTQDALQNPHNRAILERLPGLKLPDAWLVAGCLFQTVWNLRSGRPPIAGIKDYDLFYFDASDLSAQAEMAVQARVEACCADLGITVEIKNQARVHTWYPDYFGFPYPALTCSQDGLDRFLVRCTCVGLQACGAEPVLYAPNGLDELYQGILRPNPLCDHRTLFTRKVASYRARWGWLETRA
ncbi:nucleotidyltransferase family protein [Variovorax terrae]|uniref:Nucleotidyltransferase family protein n=1 Tax=Variovorax terrae TaxID=2923278 RepID=A0A9X1VTQ2_9BURK|nr:nucleotidyltransferase family protein [Variovorax terrae]MCJ0763646.1 nucleotidyltransferase family protein [Variovorax terrae]